MGLPMIAKTKCMGLPMIEKTKCMGLPMIAKMKRMGLSMIAKTKCMHELTYDCKDDLPFLEASLVRQVLDLLLPLPHKAVHYK
jgi:hypothetical protein